MLCCYCVTIVITIRYVANRARDGPEGKTPLFERNMSQLQCWKLAAVLGDVWPAEGWIGSGKMLRTRAKRRPYTSPPRAVSELKPQRVFSYTSNYTDTRAFDI